MKIAIVAPSHVPFIVGGAEKLWMGLHYAFNRYTHHSCELFKIPASESSFWELIDSYKMFYTLDFSGFDMLISGKYPAWMCQHDNHMIYMLHTLRGLYDQYNTSHLELSDSSPDIKEILKLLNHQSTNIGDIFDALENIRDKKDSNNPLFSFPGPFIRRIIHALDVRAMRKAKKFIAISETVARRLNYFPEDARVEVLYPPSTLVNLLDISREYFFTASRLDYGKRIDLLIQAYLTADVSIPLKIAGTGPLEKQLRNMTNGDNRVEFLGFVSDVQLEELYNHAYAVPYVPKDEDYGLIALESMRAGKPLIICSDSGGPTEFVSEDTGYICSPDVDSLAKAFRTAASDPEKALKLGRNGQKLVEKITWEETIERLCKDISSDDAVTPQAENINTSVPYSSLNYIFNRTKNIFFPFYKKLTGKFNFSSVIAARKTVSWPASNEKKRRKILALSTYPVYPPRGGGQNRIFYLYKQLAKKFDIMLLATGGESSPIQEIAENVWQITVGWTPEFQKFVNEGDRITGTASADAMFLIHSDAIPQFKIYAKQLGLLADLIILEHPYCWPIAKTIGKKLIFSSHNVEYILKKEMYEQNEETSKIINMIKKSEKEAFKQSNLNIFCCNGDYDIFISEYGIRNSVIINNGYDKESVHFVSQEARNEYRKSNDCRKPLILFMGSWHKPNIEAVEYIIKLARKLREYNFLIIGSVGIYFKNYNLPENIKFTGVVDDLTKQKYLSLASVAINPMFTGSGSNLKMLDYMGSGIPVVSTKIGARSHIVDDSIFLCRNIEEFPDAIIQALTMDPTMAYRYATKYFSWENLGNDYIKEIENIFP